jgi:hypothetical protein
VSLAGLRGWAVTSVPRYPGYMTPTRGITTQHTTSFETVMPRPAPASREATPSSNKEASSDIAAHCAQEGVKGSNKRCKQCPQGTTTMTNRDDGRDWDAGSSNIRHTSTAARCDKCLARPPIDHFKRLLQQAYPNHAYTVRHKLKDYGMMRSFMTSRSLTWGAEHNEGPDRSVTVPSGRHRMSSPGPKIPTHCGWGHGGSGV